MAINVLYIDTRQQFQPTPLVDFLPPPLRLVFESIIQYLYSKYLNHQLYIYNYGRYYLSDHHLIVKLSALWKEL